MTLKTFNEESVKLNQALLQQLINNDNFDEVVLKG